MSKKLATNYMITKIAERFGATSNEAMLMRFMVRSYITARNRSYEECVSTFETLIKKKVK